MRLTDISVRALAAPPTGSKVYYDDTLKGFGVRVSTAGTKAFILASGKSRDRTTIGRYPTVSLQDARKKAQALIGDRASNQRGPTRMAFNDAISLFVADKTKRNRASTIDENERILRKYFVALHRKNLADIEPAAIARILEKLSGTPGTALHAFWTLRTFLRWCYKKCYIDRNPIDRLEPPPNIASRERVLNDDELRFAWAGAHELGGHFGDIVKLLILTGQRRTETGSVQAGWLITDDNQPTLCFPGSMTKNRRRHTFPISARAADILRSNITKGTTILFPARGSTTTPFNGWSKAKAQLDKKIIEISHEHHKLVPWVLHDLRRTYVTNLQRLKIPLEVREALVNHISGDSKRGVAGIYGRHDHWDEMVEAVHIYEQWFNETILQIEEL